MKKYYLHNGTEQEGAFDKEDLKAKNITKETPVWFEGLEEWTPAGKIEELNELFKSTTPPPFEKKVIAPPIEKLKQNPINTTSAPTKKTNNTGKIVAISAIGLVVIIIGFFVLNNMMNNGGDGGSDQSTYEEKVMTVEEIENSQPTNFLTADGTYNENFWGDKLKIHGTIHNAATVATYKDAVVRVTYYSKSKTALGTNDYTVYDVFPPNSTKDFEMKIANFKDVNSIGWSVVNATVN